MTSLTTEEFLVERIGLKEYTDFDYIPASDFENIICHELEQVGKVERQVRVPERGDGYGGFIDVVLTLDDGTVIPIEIDRKSARAKSIFKVRSVNPENAFVITRSPFRIFKV